MTSEKTVDFFSGHSIHA